MHYSRTVVAKTMGEPVVRQAGKILVYGAGVIGSLYAARFAQAGFDVTVVARGDRLRAIREAGVSIRHAYLPEEERVPVRCLERFDPEQDYDLVLITVRAAQVMAAVGDVGPSGHAAIVAVIGNNFHHHAEEADAVGKDRFLLGFGCFAGYREDGYIRYVDGRTAKRPAAQHVRPTTLGTISVDAEPALQAAIRWFARAGLGVRVSTDIVAWLRCHAALVFPLAGAIYACGGEQARLSRTRDALVLGVRACRELFQSLRRLGVKTEPRRLVLVLRTPEWLLVPMLGRFLGSEAAAIAVFGHANADRGRDEIAGQAQVLDTLARTSGFALSNWGKLLPYFPPDSVVPLLRDGSRALRARLW